MLVTSIDDALFKKVLGHFATGVTIVTAMESGQPVGFTCQSFVALSLDPPMIAIVAGKTSTSWPRMIEAGTFCVNILADHQEALSRSFAISGSEKFAGVQWTIGVSGAPVLDSCLAAVECALGAIYDVGDHELVTGHVLNMQAGSGRPLVFYRSGFVNVPS
jgi:3-hydroxy-9,10-secoandrosta-1,3,5(10)-triene-9,17-dione monooxygenase reductase component